MGHRAARGGKVEVTELGPNWLPLLPMCAFSIMETILALNTSRNSLEECFCRCEQHLHTPGRHHHTRRSRRGVAAPGAITIAHSGTLGPSRHVEAACRLCYHGSTSPCREVNSVNSCLREVLTQLCQQCLSRGVNTCQHLFERGVSTVCVDTVSTLIHGPCLCVRDSQGRPSELQKARRHPISAARPL